MHVQEKTSPTITGMTKAAYKLGATCELICNRMWADLNKKFDSHWYTIAIRRVKEYALACAHDNMKWWRTADPDDNTTKVLKDACSELAHASYELRDRAGLRNEEDYSIAAAVHAQVAGMYQAAAAYHANAAYRAAAVSPAVAFSRLAAIKSGATSLYTYDEERVSITTSGVDVHRMWKHNSELQAFSKLRR